MIGLVLKVAACADPGQTKTERKWQKMVLAEWSTLEHVVAKKVELHQKAATAALIMRWIAEIFGGSVGPISTELFLCPPAACAIVQQIRSMTRQATAQLAGCVPHAGIASG